MPLSSVVGAQSIIKPGVCTSSTRPAVPFEGQMIYETDTDKVLVWNGTAWLYSSTPQTTEIGGAWVAYTPVITQGVTITKTINYCKYSQVNKLVTFIGQFVLTSAGSALNELNVFIPITNNNANVFSAIGSALYFDASAARYYNLVVVGVFADRIRFIYDNTANYFGVNPNVAVANTDQLTFTCTYEAV